MSDLVKKLIPKSLENGLHYFLGELKLKKSYSDNFKRFKKYSFGKINDLNTFEQMEARITKIYHSVEKGFSYDEVRLGFGKSVINELIDLLNTYNSKGYPKSAHCYRTALSNLSLYIKLHEDEVDVSELKDIISQLGNADEGIGGAIIINRIDIEAQTKMNFKDFSFSRNSIRTFSQQSVDIKLIEEALLIAQNTPSACNRQSWKVRVISDPKIKEALRKNQNGNRGFGAGVDKYLLVTTDVQYFARPREFSQPYIDGGMYAMNLLYALHFVGLAAVSLSAALSPKQEKNIRRDLNVSDAENLILFIGVGNYKNKYKIPKSDRREPKYEII